MREMRTKGFGLDRCGGPKASLPDDFLGAAQPCGADVRTNPSEVAAWGPSLTLDGALGRRVGDPRRQRTWDRPQPK